MEMRKVFVLVMAISVLMTSCYTYRLDIGKGAPKKDFVSVHKKRWYLLWGLSPLNTVDDKKLAAGATDYSVRSQTNIVDFLIGIPTLYFLRSQTVTVKMAIPVVKKLKKKGIRAK